MSNVDDRQFERVLVGLLKPLARSMISYGVTLGTAQEALKQALVQAALTQSGQQVSDSRLSLMTGIHRKDIKRLRHTDAGQSQRRKVNYAAMVISLWGTDPLWQGADGAPLELPRTGEASFETLVRHARVDTAPGTVAQAMMDQDLIEETENGLLRLKARGFLPRTGSAEQLAAYEATISAHLEAATENLLSAPDSSRNFDRAVRYTHLSKEAVQELRALAEDRARILLEEFDARARNLQGDDPEGSFVLGSYILTRGDKEQGNA